jgi:uncharacterized protein with GYD domain
MSKYILLLNWTEQGAKAIKESGKRYDAAKVAAKTAGVTMETIYMTFGPYDLVAIADAPNDAAMASFNLKLTSQGNIRGLTLKAFPEAEYKEITAAV